MTSTILRIAMRCAALAIIAMAGTSAFSQTFTGTGRVTGVVTEENGRGVPGARVSIHLDPSPASPLFFTARTVSGATGAFSVAGLPAGTFHFCVQAVGTDLIDPCLWNPKPPTAVVTAGQAATVHLLLAKGQRLKIRIEDRLSLLTQHEGKTNGANLLVGAFSPMGLFTPAQVTSKDSSGRDQEVLVPTEMPLNVSVLSHFFALANDKGAPFAGIGGSSKIQVPKGGMTTSQKFIITGIKPGR